MHRSPFPLYPGFDFDYSYFIKLLLNLEAGAMTCSKEVNLGTYSFKPFMQSTGKYHSTFELQRDLFPGGCGLLRSCHAEAVARWLWINRLCYHTHGDTEARKLLSEPPDTALLHTNWRLFTL